ncbi:Oidioi.mRNA.OKI2018_I69.PAR.g13101.t1.cds [Oikopleura dioica]|uniref:Oidioi.mRNA.OKI2018_I69.PAR.g13101.t1.cds n=1 Tax=Oikopleura dioica TaxID=34765 RepID=A0ABN7S3R4_OIKDI|nr:Oidioi.mRNA.OKI2018_I69.PAR.g13101.t1.cds [Oikopleura dioica]
MGFDAEIDESSKINDEINCGVCRSILEEPSVVTCCQGHFCKKCLDMVKQNALANNFAPRCPNCRKGNFKEEKARLMAKVLSTIKLMCPVDECGMSVPYDKFKEHQKACLALQGKKCPECKQATSLKKAHEHWMCFEKNARRLKEAKKRYAAQAKELEEIKKEQPPGPKRKKVEVKTENEAPAKNGWTLKFAGATCPSATLPPASILPTWGGCHYLWICNKDGGVPFKAVVQEILTHNGHEFSREETTSKLDGHAQRMASKFGFYESFVRYNITLL